MALAGVESKKYHNESFFGYGTGLEIEDPNYIYLGNVTANKNVASVLPTTRCSRFGKLNYTYDNKYLASFTIRRDASSRLSRITTTTGSLVLGRMAHIAGELHGVDKQLAFRPEDSRIMGYQR